MLVHLRASRRDRVRATLVLGRSDPGVRAGGRAGNGWYGGLYAVPEVVQTRIATVETSIFDVKSQRLAWTGVIRDVRSDVVPQESSALADVIVAGSRRTASCQRGSPDAE